MVHIPMTIPFNAASTAEDVLAGLDLTGRSFLITGCNAGLGLETMRRLAACGARLIGLARTEAKARWACEQAGGDATPIVCDLADLASVAAAAAALRRLGRPIDAVIANAGMIAGGKVERVRGIERQFFVNHVAHHALITQIADLVPNHTGRIVVLSSVAGIRSAPRNGIRFDDLSAQRSYRAMQCYGQSKLANAIFAKALSRRLAPRGIAVNSVHPGVIFDTNLFHALPAPLRLLMPLGRAFTKTIPQGAATQCLVAASPLVAGITGEYWANCQIAAGSKFLRDDQMAARLWQVTEDIITAHR